MAQISKMNEELNIFLTKHMPDAIMLLGNDEAKPKEKELKLINDKFLQILDVSDAENNILILDLVK
jgi:hypothetical protein